MIKREKAQGMPINVINIAALALIVLVILLAIFTGRIKIFSENLQSCPAKQGECEPGSKCPPNKALVTNTDCPKDKVCCVTVFNAEEDKKTTGIWT